MSDDNRWYEDVSRYTEGETPEEQPSDLLTQFISWQTKPLEKQLFI